MKQKMRRAFMAANNGQIQDVEILDLIFAERPDLVDQKMLVPQAGNSSHTFIFNDEVIKAPKESGWRGTDDLLESFIAEVQVQSMAAAVNPLVPKVTYVGKDAAFFAMEKKPGVSLQMAFAISVIKPDQRRALAYEIAAFKLQMETLGADRYVPLNRETRFMSERKIKLALEAMKNPLFSTAMTTQAADFSASLESFIDEYPKRKPVVTHGDLHHNNVLVDPVTKKVTAFLDFGRVGRTLEPEIEFMSQGESWDENFAKMIHEAYQDISKRQVRYDRNICVKALQMLAMHREMDEKPDQEKDANRWQRVAEHISQDMAKHYRAIMQRKGM